MKLGSFIVGLIVGAALLGIVGWKMAPGMMLKEYQSPNSVEQTVEKLKAAALAKGWVVPSIKPLHKSIKKHGGGDLPPVMLVNLCQADHAYNILKDDASKIVSVMMPCTISVYQKGDGKTYIGAMNASLLGSMFGGKVAEVMAGAVSDDQQSFIAAAVN